MLYAKTEEQTYDNEVIIYLLEYKMEKYIQCNPSKMSSASQILFSKRPFCV